MSTPAILVNRRYVNNGAINAANLYVPYNDPKQNNDNPIQSKIYPQ